MVNCILNSESKASKVKVAGRGEDKHEPIKSKDKEQLHRPFGLMLLGTEKLKL